MGNCIHIGMWSGPRNLSTAMMRSFGARRDCFAVDEPFYGAYLAASGIDHPMREATLASMETEPDRVVERVLQDPPDGSAICYHKHMVHHMLDGFDVSWASGIRNVFLIRDPARVMASYEKRREAMTADDLGFTRQVDLFNAMRTDDHTPPVIDSADILADPAAALEALCEAVGIEFDANMLSWEAGPRPEDGVWAAHWYDGVWGSTGFGPPDTSPRPQVADKAMLGIGEAAYEKLRVFSII